MQVPVFAVIIATRFCEIGLGQHGTWIFETLDEDAADAADAFDGDAEDFTLALLDDGGHNPITRLMRPMDRRTFKNTKESGSQVEIALIG